MRRILLIAAAIVVSVLAMAMPASARLGIAPAGTTAAEDDAIIQVKGGQMDTATARCTVAGADIITAGAAAVAITTAGAAVKHRGHRHY